MCNFLWHLKVFYFIGIKCASDCFLYLSSSMLVNVQTRSMSRSGRQELFCKTGVLHFFCKIQRKALVLESLFYQSYRPEACSFIEKETLAKLPFCVFKNTFTEHHWWLLLLTSILRLIL